MLNKLRLKTLLKNKEIILISAVIIIMALMAGCSSNPPDSKEDTGEKELIMAVSRDLAIDRLDAASYNGLINLYPMIYDSLVEYGEKGEILPSLAEDWDISDDGTVYTFYLRQDVKFSDGTDFDAEATKFSIERWYGDPAHSSLSVSNALLDVEVVDQYTIRLTFDKRYYPFLTELTYPRPVRIISPSAVEPYGDVNGEFIKPIGTGEWIVESYTKDQQGVLVPNPYYRGKKSAISRLVLKVIPDPQSRVMALQSGEIDLSGGSIGSIPLESISALRGNNDLKTEFTASTKSYYLVFNYENQFLQDINVRKALNLAVNKQTMVDNLLDGVGQPAQGLFQFTVPYVTEANNKWYEYDQAQAKMLLEQAGFQDLNGDGILEKDGQPLELNLVLQNQEFPEWKNMCEFVQSELKKIGIKINLQMLDSNAYYDALWSNREYDLIIYRTYSDSWNPHGFLLGLFYGSGDNKAVGWSDSELEQLIDEVLPMLDQGERQAKYDEIFARMHKEAMFLPLYYPDEIFVTNKKVRNFAFASDSYAAVKWDELDVE